MVMLALFIIIGSSNYQTSNDSTRYVYTVTIKDKTYGITDVEVPTEQIGEKLEMYL